MYKNQRIIAVIPAHNEALKLGGVLAGIPEFVDHIIVVNDCSTDDTASIIESCEDARVIGLRTNKNLGVGGATMLGYAKALELSGNVAVKIDGDGQMSSAHLYLLLDAIIDQGYEYAKGNRFLAGDSLHLMPRHRLFGNVVLTFANKLASGYWHVFDPQNGYTAIKGETLRRLNLAGIHQRYFFENDMLINLNFQNARVRDVAIPASYSGEVSEINPFKIGVTFPLLFISRFWRRIYQKYVLRDFSPIALFLFMGIVLLFWGLAFGIYHWILSIVTEHVATTGTVMLAVLPLILGFQLILQAIVLDIQETPK
jgi:glycosyltransferase involved in cell wall biosynthesis